MEYSISLCTMSSILSVQHIYLIYANCKFLANETTYNRWVPHDIWVFYEFKKDSFTFHKSDWFNEA